MTQILSIHPDNPQKRLIRNVVEALQQGGVVAYPTDSGYALGCKVGNKDAQERIRRIRQLDKDHHFTLICKDLSELSTYAKVSNPVFRTLKAHTPGPYTFLLLATQEVPRRLQHSKRKTIGIRVPANRIALEILYELGEPLMSVTLIMPDDEVPLADAEDIYENLQKQIEMIVDGGYCGIEPTTVVDLVGEHPIVIRHGKGNTSDFE